MNENTIPRSRPHREGYSYPPSRKQLQWLQMSFTGEGLHILKSYRARMSLESGRPVSLGQSLDALLKSHPSASGEAL